MATDFSPPLGPNGWRLQAAFHGSPVMFATDGRTDMGRGSKTQPGVRRAYRSQIGEEYALQHCTLARFLSLNHIIDKLYQ